MKTNLPFCTFKNCEFYNEGNCVNKERYDACELMRLKMQSLDELEEEVEGEIERETEKLEDLEFIWGIKSWDDITASEANAYTMNDIDIFYDKKRKIYMLGVETAYVFDDKKAECDYLGSLLARFRDFMEEKGYDTDESYNLWFANPCTVMTAESIPELYTNFRIFVEGYKALYEKERE